MRFREYEFYTLLEGIDSVLGYEPLQFSAFDPCCRAEDDWTEEDEAAAEQIVKEVDALPYLEHSDLGVEDWEGSEEGSGEDRSEESEGEEP